MAKPDLDDGYLRFAHELFAAVCCAGFNRWEMVVLREVFDQVYGPKKSRTAKLSPTDVAKRVGTYKESIVRAIRTLGEAGVLSKTEGGEYRFIKDYETWRHGDKPRFSPPESAYCAAAKRIKASNADGNNGAPKRESDSLKTGTTALPSGTTALPDGDRIHTRREQRRSPTGTVALPDGNNGAPPKVVPPTPPIGERTRVENLGEEEEGGGEEFAPAPAQVAPLPPEYKAVGLYAEEQGGDVSWAIWSDRMGRAGHPAALIRRAIDEAAGAGKLSQAYAAKILQRWAVEGPPNGRAAPPPAPKPVDRPYVKATPDHFHPNDPRRKLA